MSSTFLYGANQALSSVRLHYLRYGGKGQPLILVPGITSPAITWGFVAERLGQFYDTYVLDVRGRGLSSTGEGLDYGTDACSQDIVDFAKSLGLKNYVLAGHSMGARFAIRSATLDSDGLDKLVLIDPPVSGPGRRAYPSKLNWYVDSIEQSLAGMSGEQMKAFCPTWTEEQLQLRAEWLHTCYLPAIVKAFNDFHDDDIHQYIPQLSVPALLMVAGKGGVILPEDEAEIQQLNAGVTVARIPGAGHMIPWDDEADFFRVLGRYLNCSFPEDA
ncbi:alpha/beta fold hydrolase [Tatumella citrea]|uniref:Alpha/beta hydrolase n=1 Tax=Tatumella citrea TaxID=53336 RepID=A0A1Y0LK54_TATCI|nr:alpha/beta hydrolase [Tatumella citrea]ARU94442.1 alpha/beta hydrolase [Tatumella citrea]ARU98481.1 alpha/beta hydrolase [Tatumella citrea]